MSDAWRLDHPWAPVYDFIVSNDTISRFTWAVGMGSDVRKLHAEARRAIGSLPAGSSVLDVPCGGGVALRGITPRQGLRYVAGDISPAMLDRTRGEASKLGVEDQVEYAEVDVGAIPFEDRTFDLVVSFTSLHCFPDPALALREMARVLKPDATLSGSFFPADAGMRYVPVRVAGRAMGILGPGGTTRDLRAWASAAGFEQLRIDRSGAITYFTARRPKS